MKIKLSLLDQALNEEKKLALAKKRGKAKRIDESKPAEVLRFLLPNYEPNEKMKLWHAALQLEKGIKGGVRSGKTYGLGANAIVLSYINRPLTHLSLAPSFDNACETVVPVLCELCETNGLRYEWLKSSRSFKIYHGSGRNETANILIVSADSFFKGVTAASGDVNEPFSIDKGIVTVWWERISHPRSKRLERAWGGTAEPEKMNWGEEYFEKEKYVTKDVYVDVVTTYDNKHLPKEYIKSLEDKYDAKMKEVYMLGKHVNLTQSPAYYAFDLRRNVCEAPKKLSREIILGFDFNVDPMCCAELSRYGSRYIQTGEYRISNSNTDELCEYVINSLRMKYETKEISVVITGDASGRQRKTSAFRTDYEIIKSAFERAGIAFTLYVPQANPPVRDRVNWVNKMLETERFKIVSGCKYSIRDRGLVQWKQTAEKFALDKSKKDVTHMSDAADYGLMISKRLDCENAEVSVFQGERRW